MGLKKYLPVIVLKYLAPITFSCVTNLTHLASVQEKTKHEKKLLI